MAGGETIYLDYNAAAPLLPGVWERMAASAQTHWANPSSPHRPGQRARARLEEARGQIGQWLGVEAAELTFTSGGSEANTMLLKALAQGGRPAHMITSTLEHPSILRGCAWLERQGVAVDYLEAGRDGVARVEQVSGLIRPETRLISLQAANNETGVIQPLHKLAAQVPPERRLSGHPDGRQGALILLHTDAVQAAGRMALPLNRWGLDAATISAHKLGGPKGVGALWARKGAGLEPLVLGGGQERGLRAGTESLFLAEGFAQAAQWWAANAPQEARRVAALRDALEQAVVRAGGWIAGWEAAETEGGGLMAARLPNTLCFGFAGLEAPPLLARLDMAGVALSSGSACQSGALEPSHVLLAMGMDEARVRGGLRASLGHATTPEEVQQAAQIIIKEAQALAGKTG